MKQQRLYLLVLILALALAGCQPAWTVTVQGPDGAEPVNRQTLKDLAEFAVEVDNKELVPLERVFVEQGYQLIDQIVIAAEDGQEQRLSWANIAEDAYWLNNGKLLIDGTQTPATTITVEPSAELASVEASITDITPTAAHALGIPAPENATGQVLSAAEADHVLLLFLDGFGYRRYGEALQDGLIPNLAALEPPLLALTTYPPITPVSSASLLTGTTPNVHGVRQRGLRQTETQTLFDVAAEAGLSAAAVEGEALAFALRSVNFTLSGDRDGNGSTDDNVLANALSVLAEGMPDLFFVHFHGIDDAGHTYGHNAPEEQSVVQEVDEAVGQILAALPANTLVIIFADHGQHLVNEDEELGNHGQLIERDMLIPIFIVEP